MNLIFLKNKEKLLLVIFLLISILLMIFTSSAIEFTLSSITGMITYPFISLYTFVIEGTINFFNSIKELKILKEENAKLKKEIANLKKLKFNYENLKQENKELKKILNLRENIEYPVTVAKIVGKDPLNLYSILIINKGLKDSIKVDMPVFIFQNGEKCIVGKVIKAGLTYSKIETIFNPHLFISVKEFNTNNIGIAKGNAPESYKIKVLYMSNNASIYYKDKFITSGNDGIFPEGYTVGWVSYVKKDNFSLYQDIWLEPAVKLSNIDYVFVILKENNIWKIFE